MWVGGALVVHGDTDLVAFTGSVPTGQRIGALCAEGKPWWYPYGQPG